MSKLNTLSKLPEYIDEFVDVFWLTLQTAKAYRQESPYFDVIVTVLTFSVVISVVTIIRRRLKKKT